MWRWCLESEQTLKTFDCLYSKADYKNGCHSIRETFNAHLSMFIVKTSLGKVTLLKASLYL